MARFMRCIIASLIIIAAATTISAQKASEVGADFEKQLQQEEAAQPVTYEVELLDWKNPDGKTYTGRPCNVTTPKGEKILCDPLFKYNVEVLRNHTKVTGGAHIISNSTCLTWPGKTPVDKWLMIGGESYDDVDEVEKIGIVRLSPVPEGELQDVILRVHVLDRGMEHDLKSAIGFFMCILPGTSNGRYMKAQAYELRSEALWSGPMHCFPAAHFDRFLAPYIDFEAQGEQELIVRFRAYRQDDKKDTAAEVQQVEIDKQAKGHREARGYHGRHHEEYRHHHRRHHNDD